MPRQSVHGGDEDQTSKITVEPRKITRFWSLVSGQPKANSQIAHVHDGGSTYPGETQSWTLRAPFVEGSADRPRLGPTRIGGPVSHDEARFLHFSVL